MTERKNPIEAGRKVGASIADLHWSVRYMSKGGDLEELEKIQQMRIQYTNYYDTGDLEGVVSLFADDATVDAGAAGGAKGIDEVPAYFCRSNRGH